MPLPKPPVDSNPGLDLQPLHTFGLQARVHGGLHLIQSDADLAEYSAAVAAGQAVCLLGEGSNTVFCNPSPTLEVWKLAMRGMVYLGCEAGYHRLQVMAAENWHNLVEWTVAKGLPGLENLALIPGTVGAAPVQNIGAYGLELAERLESVEVWDVTACQRRVLLQAECNFAYRDSLFKQCGAQRYVILSVVMRLPVQWQPVLSYKDLAQHLAGLSAPSALDIFQAVCEIRAQKLPDPGVLGNAGSFFKNPVVCYAQASELRTKFPQLVSFPLPDGQEKLAAGWLIDQAGLKGFRLEQVGVYDRQALILVNHGNAHGAQLLALIRHVQDAVFTQFGVQLEPEPNLV